MSPPRKRGRPLLAVLAFGALFPAAGVRAQISPGGLRSSGPTAGQQAAIFAQAAAAAAKISPGFVIAIVDRNGRELLVRSADAGGNVTQAQEAVAVSKAGTAVFLSSDGEALTSRTAGFIVQQHYPPGIRNTPPGPLVGVEYSSMALSDVNYFSRPDGSRIPGTRLYGSPGGVPLYVDGALVGGIGVTGNSPEVEDGSIYGPDSNEIVALTGQVGFEPPAAIEAGNIYVGGIAFPYVASSPLRGVPPLAPDTTGLQDPQDIPRLSTVLGGVEGEVRAPVIADPINGTISGQARLSQAEVSQIIAAAAARARSTRAAIRLPVGQMAEVFISVVNNPNRAGAAPAVLGTFRTPDATIFSWDVSVQKARTALFYSDAARAFSARTVGYLAQSTYPPGIDGNPPGPFNGMQERYAGPIITGSGAIDGNLPNGITIFPGGFPLYRNGVLIGAVGVSGDGVDEDDLIAYSGAAAFEPASTIRADYFLYSGIRLPYAVFPRDPALNPPVAAVSPPPLVPGTPGPDALLESPVTPRALPGLGPNR